MRIDKRTKENQSGKISTIWFPSLNSLLKKQKEGKNLLHFLSTSIRGDFNQICYDLKLELRLHLGKDLRRG